MGHTQHIFRLFLVLFKQTLMQLLQQINVKMFIQYTMLGFEHTTRPLDQGSRSIPNDFQLYVCVSYFSIQDRKFWPVPKPMLFRLSGEDTNT